MQFSVLRVFFCFPSQSLKIYEQEMRKGRLYHLHYTDLDFDKRNNF